MPDASVVGAKLHRSDQGAVLLTGGTGFVGMELLARYLERTERTVFVLVRADDQESAARRLRETLANALGASGPYARAGDRAGW